MVDFLSVFKKTSAYKTLVGEKKADRLSHAYLLVTPDGENLIEYLKICAKIILCKESEVCGECRTCKLIDSNTLTDLKTYPQDGESVLVKDVSDLIEESFIKPIEAEKKIFIIDQAQTMNIQAQNKLLKTLEEPPKNVVIIIGTTSEYPILPTIRSRVKKLTMQALPDDVVISALQDEFEDLELLKSAVYSGDGTLGKAVKNYNDPAFIEMRAVVLDTLINMKSSKNILEYSTKISGLKFDTDDLLDAFELLIKELLYLRQGKKDLIKSKEIIDKIDEFNEFSLGAVVSSLEKITEARKRKKFNVNSATVIEWLLFQILEAKYKWRK